jgi:hypothetical protein
MWWSELDLDGLGMDPLPTSHKTYHEYCQAFAAEYLKPCFFSMSLKREGTKRSVYFTPDN